MFVHPNQLVEKCLIVSDVYSQTNYPIIKKDTIVTTTHIKVLNYFLIDKVEVSPKLINGQAFEPTKIIKDSQELNKNRKVKEKISPFYQHYLTVVSEYEKLFKQWQSGAPIDIHQIRQLIVPLLDRAEQNQATIFLLGKQTTENTYLYHHSVAISLLASILAKRLGFKKESNQIGLAAFIANSGMAKVNQLILNQTGKLSHADFLEIKKHPLYSYQLIEKNAALNKSAKLGILQHHERIDGNGYPLGLKDEKINSYAKIIAIADAYHAMTSYRSYQERASFYQAIINMKKEVEKQFDSRYFNVFMTCFEDALLEEKVYLSNGKTGSIVAIRFNTYPEIIIQVHDTYDVISLLDQNEIKVKSLIQR